MIPGLLLALALAGPSAPEPVTVFRNVRVFDGAALLPATDVLVRGARIGALGKALAVPAGAQVIDGAGKTLMPGLIDAHAHVHGAAHLEQAAIFGVTTVLDMGTDAALARSLRPGAPGRADLRSATLMITAPGGHGTEYGFPIPTLAAAADAPAFVRATTSRSSTTTAAPTASASPPSTGRRSAP